MATPVKAAEIKYSCDTRFPISEGMSTSRKSKIRVDGRALGCINDEGSFFTSFVSFKIVEDNAGDVQFVVTFSIGRNPYKCTFKLTIVGNDTYLNAFPDTSTSVSVLTDKGSTRFVITKPIELRVIFGDQKPTFWYNFVFNSVPNVQRGIQVSITESYVIGEYTYTSNKQAQPKSLSNEGCPAIVIFAQTDAIYGANCRTVVFRTPVPGGFREWKRVFNFTAYVAPSECDTLLSKIWTNGALLDNILEYACLRYFLWFLIMNKWTKEILLRSNTDLFFRELSKSKYACWVGYFNSSKIKGYDRYFL